MNPLDLKKKLLLSESNELDDVNKDSEMVCASSESNPLPVTDTSSSSSTDTPCHPKKITGMLDSGIVKADRNKYLTLHRCHLRNYEYIMLN